MSFKYKDLDCFFSFSEWIISNNHYNPYLLAVIVEEKKCMFAATWLTLLKSNDHKLFFAGICIKLKIFLKTFILL